VLHAWQVSVQDVSQQTPSLQKPVAQVVPDEQGLPFDASPTQIDPEQ
jgi:hypothetical protein